jgi:hypothetical protein
VQAGASFVQRNSQAINDGIRTVSEHATSNTTL